MTYTKEITLPPNISIKKKENYFIFSGPLGSTILHFKKLDSQGIAAFSLKTENKIIISSPCKSFFSTILALVENKIQGVSRGFVVYLRIVGLGYRAILEDNLLTLKLGFSHQVTYQIPQSIRIFLIDPTFICIFGVDKNQVTQIAAKIRQIKPPSVYKGKGIRLLNESLNLKQGKQK